PARALPLALLLTRRASPLIPDPARRLSPRVRGARAFEFRGRARGARDAADRGLARRPVRIDRDGAAQRGGDPRAGARRAVARGGAVAAPDRLRHAGATLRRPLLSRRRPLPLSDLAAHALGGGGVGARRSARHRASALSPFQRAGGEASRKPRARARSRSHVRDAGEITAISPPFIPAHSASKTRVNALMAGIQGSQSVALGPRFRGDERRKKSAGRELTTACGRFRSR